MNETILDWFERTVRRFPSKTALRDESESLTFSEWSRETEILAGALISATPSGRPVAVMTGRRVHTPPCFLAAAAAGCFYAPMDGNLPEARLARMLSVIRAEVMIADREFLPLVRRLGFAGAVICREDALSAARPADREELMRRRKSLLADDPLYVIFTSGSSGTPKGVVASHRSLMCYIEAVTEVLSVTEADRLGNQSPLDYIAAVRDVYFPVLKGAETVILPKKIFAVPAELFPALNHFRITTLCWSTSALSIAARMDAFASATPKYLKKVCFSGSVMPPKVLRCWQDHLPGVRFFNQYGPTEATASCTYYEVAEPAEDGVPIPIGRPYPGYRILLLSEDGSRTPDGEIGEICIAGPAVALGYYRDPERSRAAFVQNPLNPAWREWMYRTGDLGRIREDGELEFHGRRDRQIKLLGHRVELDEVENAAEAVPDVGEACVFFDPGRERLALCFTGNVSRRALALALRQALPDFMVPRTLLPFAAFPLLPNGKTDRNALKKMIMNHSRPASVIQSASAASVFKTLPEAKLPETGGKISWMN